MSEQIIIAARPQNFVTIWVMLLLGVAVYVGVTQGARAVGWLK